MDKFTQLLGVAAPILRINVDTDAIIPSREMKLVSKRGLGQGLFAGWRYTEQGGREPNPDFVLNKPEYAQTSIILSGTNFGCGSSREHAVWALSEYGIRVVIAPTFGTIFYNNCTRNGILPIVLADDIVQALAAEVGLDPELNRLQIDLPKQTVTSVSGDVYHFDIEVAPKTMLVEGLDPIALTLKSAAAVDEFEVQYLQRMPWLKS